MWASLPVRSASSSGCSGRWWRWSRGCTRFCSRSSSVSVKTAWEKCTKDPADPRRRSGRARPRGLYHPRPAVGRRAAADDRRARRAGRRPEPADRRPASGRPDHGAHGGRRRTRPANARPADALTAATRAASRWTPNRRRGSELYGAHLDAEERRDRTRDAELVADVRARSRARNRQEARDRWRAAAADKLRERQDRRRKAREHRPVRRRLRRLRQRVADLRLPRVGSPGSPAAGRVVGMAGSTPRNGSSRSTSRFPVTRIAPFRATRNAAKALKKRTLTNPYNARRQWLADAHAALDASVAAAYSWPTDISDDDVLRELRARNGVGA